MAMKWNESIKKAPVTVMQIGAQSEIVRWGAGVTKIEHVQHMHAATLFFFFFCFKPKIRNAQYTVIEKDKW